MIGEKAYSHKLFLEAYVRGFREAEKFLSGFIYKHAAVDRDEIVSAFNGWRIAQEILADTKCE